MLILGLHFGHDASVTVLGDGRILSHVLRERQSRVKHAVGLGRKEIDRALQLAGVTLAEVDCCALVSTQDMELLTGLATGLSVELAESTAHPVPSPYKQVLSRAGLDVHRLLRHGLRDLFARPGAQIEGVDVNRWKRLLPEWQAFSSREFPATGWLNHYMTHDRWHGRRGLKQIAQEGIDEAGFSEAVRLGMHYPVMVRLDDCVLPGYFIDHHVCHGASVYYRSGEERAAVLTHDGGDPQRNLSGYFLYGEGNRLFVLAPHHLVLGALYRAVGVQVGFDVIGAEGKLMGLAPYGDSGFFDTAFAGNYFDIQQRTGQAPFPAWMEHCARAAQAAGVDWNALGDPNRVLEPAGVHLAAATQVLFEQSYLAAVTTLHRLLDQGGRATPALCLSGGCALNCPSNTRVAAEGPFARVFIEPNCDDGGLSTGAALYLYHNMLGRPVQGSVVVENRSAYLGPPVETDVKLPARAAAYACSRPAQVAAAAADDLAADRIVAWVEGRSEMGPRALCHRSLLASPRTAENWPRINRVKGREPWRPLAPAVLGSRAADFFHGCPLPSPYMLFTAQVTSRELPAITHVDGSARLQTVAPECGGIHGVLEALDARTGIPVVLNTSLNRPGEPIVERSAEALAFFEATDTDVLYLDGQRIAKRR